MSLSHGSIGVADGSTVQALTTTPGKMVGFATEGQSSDEQGDMSVQPDVANDKIIVTTAGFYKVDFTASGSQDDAASKWVQAVLRQEAVELANGQSRSEAAQNAMFAMSISTVIEVTQAQIDAQADGQVDLTVYLESEAGLNYLPVHAGFTVVKLW